MPPKEMYALLSMTDVVISRRAFGVQGEVCDIGCVALPQVLSLSCDGQVVDENSV